MESEVTIKQLGARGDGVAHWCGAPLYVPFALPGERVRVAPQGKRGAGRAARLLAVLEPAADRCAPACRHFGLCGGCAIQHLAAPAMVAFKRDLIAGALARRGLDDVDIAPVFTVSPATRRRAVLSAQAKGGALRLGFFARASKQLVDLAECPVMAPAMVGVLADLRNALGGMKSAAITLLASETGLDIALAAAGEPDLARREALGALGRRAGVARISWNGEVIAQAAAPLLHFGDIAVTPPPAGFVQASAEAQERMLGLVRDVFAGARRVADLFCGCGAFALPLARVSEVYAADADSAAIGALDAAGRLAGGLRPLAAEARDLFRNPLEGVELDRFQAVVFDPPRAGAAAQAAALAASTVPVVVAISCNPASFARDARTLIDGGYRLEKIFPIDQFLWSAHVELAAVFRR